MSVYNEEATVGTVTQEQRDLAARRIIGAAGFWNEGEDLDTPDYDDCVYEAGSAEYLILTDEEADERAAAYIKDSLWAFRPEFLESYVPEGVDASILCMIGEKYEDGNAAILGLVGDRLEELIGDAIASDGRGHFLAGYDNEEIEENIDGTYWYGYRIN